MYVCVTERTNNNKKGKKQNNLIKIEIIFYFHYFIKNFILHMYTFFKKGKLLLISMMCLVHKRILACRQLLHSKTSTYVCYLFIGKKF